jgi:hypothetical protein
VEGIMSDMTHQVSGDALTALVVQAERDAQAHRDEAAKALFHGNEQSARLHGTLGQVHHWFAVEIAKARLRVVAPQQEQEPDFESIAKELFDEDISAEGIEIMLRGIWDQGRAVAVDPPPPQKVSGDTSDGYHTFDELYAYRKAYNALLFNEWASRGLYDVHKSFRHSTGEDCFGGGWFVVSAQMPTGQITNHYKSSDWDLFRVPERQRSEEWDGHTPAISLERLLKLAAVDPPPDTEPRP